MGEQQVAGGSKKVREIRAATVAIAFLILCLAAFVGGFFFFVNNSIQQTRLRIEERSHAAAQVVATNANWMAQVANQTLRRVDAVLGPQLSNDPQAIQTAVDGLPPEVDVYIIDANGDILFTTVSGSEPVSVADREYFITLRNGAPFYTSGMLVSRLTDQQVFVFSKRMQRQGEFAGIIMVSFSNELLHEFWAALEMDDGSTVSLVRRDGELMARFPAPDGPVSLADHPLITEHMARADFGTYYSETSPVDGTSRVVSYRAVPRTEIIALAAVASDPTWGQLSDSVVAVVLIMLPIILALLAGGIVVLRLLRRDARRRAELEEANETNVLLFREIHHRVKNNLQSVQSLVRMQDMPKSSKIDLQSRLSAMAAMHEHIYRHDRYEDIDASELIPVVVDEVIHAYGSSSEVRYDLDHVAVDRDHVTPLSLLLSELVTNALKYAFPDGGAGIITVTVRDRGDGRCDLTVADNGVGFAPMPDTPASMGMRLIRGVVSQMGGTSQFLNDGGTRFEANLAVSSLGHGGTQGKPFSASA